MLRKILMSAHLTLALTLVALIARPADLRIVVLSSAPTNTKPLIDSGQGESLTPTYDLQTRTWHVPIQQSTHGYLSPYRISLPNGPQYQRLQMNFPAQLMKRDELVYVSTTSSVANDEKAVGKLWGGRERISNQDPRNQFRLLHDLLYINWSIEKERRGDALATARSARAALMLLQAIDSLRFRTWYVISQDSESIVDFAIATLQDSQIQGKACRWLAPTCKKKDLDALVGRVRGIDSFQLTRIYGRIYPDRTPPTLSFCRERIPQISMFLNYVVKFPEVVSPSPSRVAEELASCYVTMVRCGSPSVGYSLSQLEAAEAALQSVKSRERNWQKRLDEVQEVKDGLQRGVLAPCPAERHDPHPLASM